MLKVGVFISGRGSNLQALIEAMQKPDFPARIVLVISNNLEAQGLEHARKAGIATEVINHRTYANREAFEKALDAKLTQYGVELVCLAGFMRLLTPWFTHEWRDKLINIHPSLLPLFPGLETHKKVLMAGVRKSGCTVHFVRSEMDHGPIILQSEVPVMAGDTEEKLAARVLEAEHKTYPEAVRLIAEGRVNVLDEQVFVTGASALAKSQARP